MKTKSYMLHNYKKCIEANIYTNKKLYWVYTNIEIKA